MAIRKIARMGHSVLKVVCEPIDDPGATHIERLAADLIDTCEDIGASGLAAPQIHEPVRIFVYRVRRSSMPAGARMQEIPWTVCINPEIELLDDERQLFWERCLSLPGLYGQVPRPTHLRLRWASLDGEKHSMVAHRHHARLIHHENDHLDGVLYPMRMEDLGTLGFVSELGPAVSPVLPRNVDDFVDPHYE